MVPLLTRHRTADALPAQKRMIRPQHCRDSAAGLQGPHRYCELTVLRWCGAAIISRFEHRVQELNPQMQKVSYALKDLYSWLDNMVRRSGITCQRISIPKLILHQLHMQGRMHILVTFVQEQPTLVLSVGV